MSPKEIYIFHVGLERFYKMSMFKKLMALGLLGMYSVSPANVQSKTISIVPVFLAEHTFRPTLYGYSKTSTRRMICMNRSFQKISL